jgi:L-lactate dehydrogenase complex protein LldG
MTDARSEILSRIRSANGRASVPLEAEAAWQAIPRGYRSRGELNLQQRVAQFEDRLRDYGVHVVHCRPSEIAQTIAERLAARSKRTLLCSPDLDPAWLARAASAGVEFLADDALSYEILGRCDGVVSGCSLGIAETGTIAVCHAVAGGRRALTLLPDYHLCLVPAAVVMETVPEAVARLEPWQGGPITLISGPSATVDIEMTRIQGVHGPRTLDVLLVE